MYTQFFGLKKKPFTLSPDPEFFYFSKGHHLAFTHLEYGLLHNVGFMALTGEAGTGKTTLLRYLLNRIRAPINTAMLFNTLNDPISLLEMLAKEFEITPASDRKSDLYDALYAFFVDQYKKGKRCVIFVDEAQNFQHQELEELRMLSNLDSGSEPMVQMVLAGQPQLRNRLTHPSLEQLAQRISVHYHLAPLQPDEVVKYIEFRLRVAALEQNGSPYEKDAIDLIAGISRGIPRIINSVCDLSLTYAFADLSKTVTRQIVESVIADNELLRRGNRDTANFLLEAPHNESGAGHGQSGTGFDGDGNPNALAVSAFGGVISDLLGRISALEERIAGARAAELERSVQIVQEMLAKERENSFQLAAQLQDLKHKYKRAMKKLQQAKVLSDAGAEISSAKKARTPWRIFKRAKTTV